MFFAIDSKPEVRRQNGSSRHCEERSDDAIHSSRVAFPDCLAEPVIGPAKPDPLARNDGLLRAKRSSLPANRFT